MKNKLLLLLFLLGVVFPLSAQESEVLISTSHTSLLMLMYMLLLVQSLEVFPLIRSMD